MNEKKTINDFDLRFSGFREGVVRVDRLMLLYQNFLYIGWNGKYSSLWFDDHKGIFTVITDIPMEEKDKETIQNIVRNVLMENDEIKFRETS